MNALLRHSKIIKNLPTIQNQIRKMSLLINDPKYSFLKDLGLSDVNPGVFSGKWHGSGEVSPKAMSE